MLNEREEFLSYITFPKYASNGKNDTSFLGKFAMDTLLKSHGILRVLTVIARHYMFEDKKDIQKAYRAICAGAVLRIMTRRSQRKNGNLPVILPISIMNSPNLWILMEEVGFTDMFII